MDIAHRPKQLLQKIREVGKDLIISAVIAIFVLFFPLGCCTSWIRCATLYVGAVVFMASLISTFISSWKPKGRIQIDKKSVFISGCDSGFGFLFAQRLDDLGFQVFAGCLLPDGDGAAKLRKSASDRLHIVNLDVTKDADVKKAVDYVTENLGNNNLWAVVCIAGMNDGCDINWTDMDTIQKVMDVNLFGVIRVCKAFLPQVCDVKGRVVAITSAAGRYTLPCTVPYCMGKSGVISFCDGLRLEMGYRWGIKVSTIEPFIFKTNLTDETRVAKYITETWARAPEEVTKRYPNNYLQQVINSSLIFVNYAASDKLSLVVDCLEEAVTANNPKYTYSPGTLFSKFGFWFLVRLPKPIADFMLLEIFTAPSSE